MTTVARPSQPPETGPTPAAGEATGPWVGRKYLQLVLLLGALSALGPLTIDAYLPALPELTSQLQASDAQAQATITGLLIGLGLGQLVVGPLSDAVGRRRPLLIGLVGHAGFSVLCALAPTVSVLLITRTLQGTAGAAVAVVAMAMVRDLFRGVQAAKLLSRLILVLGVAPILAPSLGGALLRVTSWRGIFVALAVVAVVLFVVAAVALPETLPPSRRQPASVATSLRSYASLFGDRVFVALVAVAGLMFASLFAYVSGAPFILQDAYELSPQQFGLAFGANAVGLIAMTQLNPVLLHRFRPVAILSFGVGMAVLASLVLLATAVTGVGGLAGFLLPLAVVVAAAGLSIPNAPAIALSRHGERAGAAAALLGAAQFVIGGAIAPTVGALGNSAVPLAAVMLGTTGAAAVVLTYVAGRVPVEMD